jgi:hypothetical protein
MVIKHVEQTDNYEFGKKWGEHPKAVTAETATC